VGFRRKGRRTGSRSLTQSRKVIAKQRDIEIANNSREGIFSRPSPFLTQITSPEGSICIIRSLGGIGDVLMITPGIRALKKKYPKLTITVAVDRHRTWDDSYYHLLKTAPFIDHIIDARYVDRSKYDKVIDISSVCMPYEKKGLPNRNRIDLFARHMGINFLENELPFLEVEFEEYVWARSIIVKNRKSLKSPVVCFAPSSNDDMRSWKKDKARQFVELIKQRHPQILLIVFDRHDYLEGMDGFLDMRDTSVRQMAALIQQCHVYVGPDSGPMHIAGCLEKESVVLFGSIPPEARVGPYKRHLPVKTDELSCLGCWYGPCPYNVACMDKIDASLVLGKAIGKMTSKAKLSIEYSNENTIYFEKLCKLPNIADKLAAPGCGKAEIILNCLQPGEENLKGASFFDAKAKYIHSSYPSTKPPASWIESINTYDKLIVSSKACIDSFKDGGVTVPIEYVPIGIDVNKWKYREPNNTDIVTFAMVSLVSFKQDKLWLKERENLETGIAAFKKAFGDSSDVRLIIMAEEVSLPDDIFESSNISVIIKPYEESNLMSLFKNTDYLIYPNKGSEYADLPMQAMSMGIPVIGCSFGAARELMSLPCNYAVGYTLLSKNSMQDMHASINLDFLTYTLTLAKKEKHLLKSKSLEASTFISENHSLVKSSIKLLKAIGVS
tara:strand:- start:4160 stop:6163 length:2004 start_codon:yes stop_codon:yes gene_type:complete